MNHAPLRSAAAVTLGGVVLAACGGPAAPPAAGPVAAPAARAAAVAAPAPPVRLAAAEVLHAWDRRRSVAYAGGDVAALRALYAAGSAAGTSDVGTLRAYLRRGLHVEGMRMQVLALDVLADGPDLLRLRVTDRVVGATVVGPGVAGARLMLPRDAASSRVVTLRRTSGSSTWRVASVRPAS